MPCRADLDVEMDVTSGMASPSACGQAMINTVTARVRALSGWPSKAQTATVTAATATAT